MNILIEDRIVKRKLLKKVWGGITISVIVVTILIEEGGDGSRTAVPIVEQFLYWYFTN